MVKINVHEAAELLDRAIDGMEQVKRAATANAEVPGAGRMDLVRARELAARVEITKLSG